MQPRARGGVERGLHAAYAPLGRNHPDGEQEPSDLALGVPRASDAWRHGLKAHSRGGQRLEQHHLSFTECLRMRLRFARNSLPEISRGWTWITFPATCSYALSRPILVAHPVVSASESSAGLSKRPANCQSRWCLKAECTSGQNSLTTKFAPSRITLVSQR